MNLKGANITLRSTRGKEDSPGQNCHRRSASEAGLSDDKLEDNGGDKKRLRDENWGFITALELTQSIKNKINSWGDTARLEGVEEIWFLHADIIKRGIESIHLLEFMI
jgi:hypothetical protein